MRRREAIKQAMREIRGGYMGDIDQPHAAVALLAVLTGIRKYNLDIDFVDRQRLEGLPPGVVLHLPNGVTVTVQGQEQE